MPYEAIIGLEVHVQLKCASKMFTRAPYRYGEPANTLTDAVVLALPGTLPVLNKRAIEQMIKMGLMFGCDIAEECKWDRKNYWYPDLPKNYQISQYDQPLCRGGSVEIELPGPNRNVQGEHKHVALTRIHLEEDPGKLTHFAEYSLIDDNRCGVPLAEIVTEPEIRSAEEAVAFLNAIRMCLVQAGVSDCDMEKGQLRCDANVSLREMGSDVLNTRTEMKNLNSVSQVKLAIEAEIRRQTRLYDEGRRTEIIQETRRWNADKGVTVSMRSKEEAHDYRYFPDPDLMPVRVSENWKEQLKQEVPELPYNRQRRYMDELGLPFTAADVLIADRELAEFFEASVEIINRPKEVANFVANDLLRELSNATPEGVSTIPVSQSDMTPSHIAELVKLIDEGTISKQIAQQVFPEMYATGLKPSKIVEQKGLKQTSDTGELERLCLESIANNQKAVENYRAGNSKAINSLKGPVMKATKGQANPKVLDEILRKLLAE